MSEKSVREAIRQSLEISVWGVEYWPEKFIDFNYDRFAAAAFSIANAHRQSILILMTQDQRTSAFALFRPVLEASVAGEWFRFVANDELMKRALQIHTLPTTNSMIKALNKTDGGKRSLITGIKPMLWETSSDFTHGGLRQTSNWIKDGEIKSIHPDDELCEMLSILDILYIAALYSICQISKGPVEKVLSKSKEVLDRYHEAKFIAKTSGGFVRFRGRQDLL